MSVAVDLRLDLIKQFLLVSLMAILLLLGIHAYAQETAEESAGAAEEEFTPNEDDPSETAEVASEVKSSSRMEASARPYIVKNVKSFNEAGAFVTEFTFDRPYEGDDLPIDFIHQTIQVNIPFANLKDSRKKTTNINEGPVAKVVTFQNGLEKLRTQIVLKRGQTAKEVEGRLQITKNKNSLQIRILGEAMALAKAKILPSPPPIAMESSNRDSMDDMLKTAALKLSDGHQVDSRSAQSSTATAISVAKNAADNQPIENQATAASSDTEAILPAVTAANEPNVPEKPKAESEIPAFSVNKAKASDAPPFQRMILALAVVCAFGLTTMWALRKYSRRNTSRVPATQIKVITQHHLGPKKSLAIVRVAGESILIGITDQNISMLKSLSLLDEEVPEELPGRFASAMRQVEEPHMSIQIPATAYHDEEDEFAMRGLGEIKGLISRKLKDMRTIE